MPKGIAAKFILNQKGTCFLEVALSKFLLICHWPYLGLMSHPGSLQGTKVVDGDYDSQPTVSARLLCHYSSVTCLN